jgi:hypothetical protein
MKKKQKWQFSAPEQKKFFSLKKTLEKRNFISRKKSICL